MTLKNEILELINNNNSEFENWFLSTVPKIIKGNILLKELPPYRISIPDNYFGLAVDACDTPNYFPSIQKWLNDEGLTFRYYPTISSSFNFDIDIK